MHYNAIDKLEQECLQLQRWQAQRGRRKEVTPCNNEEQPLCIEGIVTQRSVLLYELSQALTQTVEPLLSDCDRLRHSYTGLHLPRDAGVRIKTGVWRLQL
ncbi:hypothetical protein DQ04_06571000, partial [Trypanosoma grayi]|uniref:hypothetical protein n=1 Tax=Trypanosoma grayi TaxID=71804 RepID=UPI0004F414B9